MVFIWPSLTAKTTAGWDHFCYFLYNNAYSNGHRLTQYAAHIIFASKQRRIPNLSKIKARIINVTDRFKMNAT